MKILGIESSCDDTAVAIIDFLHKSKIVEGFVEKANPSTAACIDAHEERRQVLTKNLPGSLIYPGSPIDSDKRILANIIISQNDEHQPFNGVVPEIAARSHMENLQIAVDRALQVSDLQLAQIDAIAATSGPGLIGGVIVGSMYARSIASVLKKPFVAINHLEGHALTVRLTNNTPYPYLLLLISGGHCQFVSIKSLGDYKILGQTLDDSVGEAFDKVAKMLNLPFPGGKHIEERAKFGDPFSYDLPKPIINQPNCDMSFSGLKTAISILISKIQPLTSTKINNIAASFQHIVGEILAHKLNFAISSYESGLSHKYSRRFVIAGGVAANQYIRSKLNVSASKLGYEMIAPPGHLCTDNAAMIAYAAYERILNNQTNSMDFCPRARWSIEDLSI